MRLSIGMRNIKTAIAIFVCLIISELLHLEYPFYAAIATIISMENSVTNSFTVGKNRMMGTFVGAGIGLIFAIIDPQNAFYCAIGIVLVIYICNLLKWNKSISIASIVFLAIMLNLQVGGSPLLYGLNRIFDTLIGVSVAVVVNYLIFPPKHEYNLHIARKTVMRRLAETAEEVVNFGVNDDLKPLKKDIADLEKYLELCKLEFHLKKDLSQTMELIEEEVEICKNIYSHMRMIQRLYIEQDLVIHQRASQQLDSESLSIVIRYHIDCIIVEIEGLGLILPQQQ
ncbi:FUSC family protein [Paenibacillus anaericanus]|uniref:Aromatic acid exporter family protein n=2 Tax=Paenibacillus TaxID=44249 RepID=A0A3S1DXV4_9BACL|nr:aromatic acid exporter family protein [Paenibacillus anaericanus]RUT47642.1 aromatic acid exporter family protein [Paenibacillus anaericanus]